MSTNRISRGEIRGARSGDRLRGTESVRNAAEPLDIVVSVSTIPTRGTSAQWSPNDPRGTRTSEPPARRRRPFVDHPLSARWRSQQLDAVLLAELHHVFKFRRNRALTSVGWQAPFLDGLFKIATRRRDDQDSGRFNVNRKSMRNVLRREDESARHGLKHQITDMECELAFEDVPRLVLPVVPLQPRFTELPHH